MSGIVSARHPTLFWRAGVTTNTSATLVVTQLMLPQEFRLSPENYSSFGGLVRVTAWCLRLCKRLCNRGKIRREDDDAKVCIPVTVSSGSNAMVLALNAMEI